MTMKECIKCGEDDLVKFEVNKVVGYRIYYRRCCKSCHKQFNSVQARIDRRVAENKSLNQITT